MSVNYVNVNKVPILCSQIADISTLEALANLQWMSVSNNLIQDMLPLVNNTGIDTGDYVDISYNFLDLTPRVQT